VSTARPIRARETARLLYVLARSTGARSIVEFGMSFGPLRCTMRPSSTR
jgi:predicted O-methyltransferase YrrM